MSESKSRETVPEAKAAYWKTVHHNWWFWLGLALMLGAMAVYVLSDNLSFLRHN
jgi:hypothetical protein